VNIDCVTSLHPVYMYYIVIWVVTLYVPVCVCAADVGRHLRGNSLTGETENWKWFTLTVLCLNYSNDQHLGKVTLKVSPFCKDIFEMYR